jgi:hypothetical protein
MTASEERPSPRDRAVRLQHQAFFEALQHGEGSRDWLAARAGLLLLRHVVAWSDANWDAEALAPEEGGVTTAIAALAADDPERIALRGVLDAVYASVPDPHARGARRRQRAAEVVADALIVYGGALLARAAWALAADVYTTVWNTRAAPDGHFNGGPDPRDAEEEGEEREVALSVSPASAVAALNLAMCYRMLHRGMDAADAYAAASAAAGRCRDPRVGETVALRARLGQALMTMDRGDLESADRQLTVLVAETAASPHLAEVHAQASRDQAMVRAARRAT